jgi:hypothetical protein
MSCTTTPECGAGGTCDAAFISDGGTLNLKVGSQACGTYTFNFSNDINQTFIANPASFPIYAVPSTIQGLTLNVAAPNNACPDESGACCDTTGDVPFCTENVHMNLCQGTGKRYGGHTSTCATINPPCEAAQTGACCDDNTGICGNNVTDENCATRWVQGVTCANLNPACAAPNPITASNPANCIIDARIPNVQTQLTNRLGFTSMTLTFQNNLTSGEDAPNDFQLTQVPATTPPNPPVIHDVVVAGPKMLTLNFTANAGSTTPFPIQPRRWTCVRHIRSNGMRCIGFQPADVNGNGLPVPADIITLVDNLNGQIQPPLPPTRCDLNRSNVCNAADIIAEVDMLNGNGYPGQNNQPTIGACPSLNEAP